MRVYFVFICFFSLGCCKEEKVSDLYELLKDPDLLLEIEKRIKGLDDEDDLFSDGEVGCYDNSGALSPVCSFGANSSTIIKTSESLQRGAEFLDDFVNISCPRDCTSLCCNNPNCDTAVYQDKGDRKCYLFRCGKSDQCVFSHHTDYMTSSILRESHKSHSFTQGEVTHSHENELENLGSHVKQPDATPEPKSTTTQITTDDPKEIKLPGLEEYCPSYLSRCEDPHAECMRQRCQCRVGYHQKHDMCRKHCRSDEFECEKVYDADSRQCVLNRYVCDGHTDCTDGSDEQNCPDKNKQQDKLSHGRPLDPSSKNGIFHHLDKPKMTDLPTPTTQKIMENEEVKTTTTTPKPITPSPTESKVQAPSDTDKAGVSSSDSQASSDTDQGVNKQEPVSSEEQKGDQPVDETPSINRNVTEEKSDNSDGNILNVLNAEAIEVESYTDSSQGPIVALALGLAITMILLIFVGCRLRTVKRRLRKGRALHSNEADYLINGMYL